MVENTWSPLSGEELPAHDAVQFDGAQVLAPDGTFSRRTVTIRDGVFAAPSTPTGPRTVRTDASALWLTPGFVDAHTHLAWRAFDAAEHDNVSEDQRHRDAAFNAHRTLRAGVTVIRDAGGFTHDLAAELDGLRAALSLEILGPRDAQGADHLRGRVHALAAAGADWIKVAATGGVGAGDRVLEPAFSREELTAIHTAAEQVGLPVMVHAWGGDALSWALDLGAASIEHAVLITERQAEQAARQGTVVVPTIWIYRDVLDMVDTGVLPSALGPAARRAVSAHPHAVRRCLEAGVQLAMGTDAGLDRQHGHNLSEVAAMIDAGVPRHTALVAGTANGARLVGHPDRGIIAPGAPADLVCFSSDPRVPATLRDPSTVVGVFADGVLQTGRGVPD